MSESQEPTAGSSPDAANDQSNSGLLRNYRWHRSLGSSTDPLFFLNHQGRLVFVNQAWLDLTGLNWKDVRGRRPRRRPVFASDPISAVLSQIAPPADVETRAATHVERHAPANDDLWDVHFFPIRHAQKLIGILGKIVSLKRVNASGAQRIPANLISLSDRLRNWHSVDMLYDEAPIAIRLREQILHAAQSKAPLWVEGEPGTGKRWLARTVHREGKDRQRVFATIDCQHIPPSQLEDLLFGRHGLTIQPYIGTLYFSQPQFLPREIQLELVQWLTASRAESQHPHEKPRIIIGCTDDAGKLVNEKRLVELFYHRLSIINLTIPPLRNRLAEFDFLARKLLHRLQVGIDREIKSFADDALTMLRSHNWPGNLTELSNVIRQACHRCSSETLGVADLPWYLRDKPTNAPPALQLDTILEQVERRLLQQALARAGNNKSKAAEMLSIWRGRLIRRLKELGLEEIE